MELAGKRAADLGRDAEGQSAIDERVKADGQGQKHTKAKATQDGRPALTEQTS